ncbi:Laccase domain protein YfiH [Planctomycetes bacterium Pla86]|uniref:Laccase domain protein YfiH n=1 Tax=Engelhardtia mirabilis TaxID=2528011 RepID=A0A518BEX8_9BACT|nr:Laccase domain protein YfiH [Planctomycetes bacterium Pla133]QDU99769.1 Laccase domain protein YfiH [Planctomycetes bacterium Pla86]
MHSSGLVGYRSAVLAGHGVPHLFTTRVGVGGDELCVGSLSDRDHRALRELAGADPGVGLDWLRQVHGARVQRVDEPDPAGDDAGDALISARPERMVLVYTADCVPILIASDGGARVAAVHAGWRGLVAGVIPAALDALGGSEPVAAIGPCLGGARAEMGPEVLEQFERADLGAALIGGEALPAGRGRVELRLAAELQLRRAGVASIDVSDRCTWTHADELHSHRRDVTHGQRPRAGRLGAMVAPTPRGGARPVAATLG